MKSIHLITFIIFSFLLFSNTRCIYAQKPNPKLAHVFQPLDGTWVGQFFIYEWKNAQENNRDIPIELTAEFFESLPLTKVDSLQVTQTYTSKDAFYQTVNITDTYFKNGETKVVNSSGINKVEGNELWCIVTKPDEKIVHRGSLPAPNTIIWQRDEKKPLRVEYFRETVRTDTYEIIGYGYYGQDNTKRNPKTWFKSIYYKQ